MNYISYEQFGVNFVSHAVSVERIKDALTETAGGPFKMGPMPAGPGGIATATASGTIGTIDVREPPDLPKRFEATLPLEMDLEVRVAGLPQRYRADIAVELSLTVRTGEPLWLLIEIAPVTPADVSVELRTEGVVAGMLQEVGNIDEEVRKQVVRVVNDRIGAPKARATREIDIAALIDRSMTDG